MQATPSDVGLHICVCACCVAVVLRSPIFVMWFDFYCCSCVLAADAACFSVGQTTKPERLYVPIVRVAELLLTHQMLELLVNAGSDINARNIVGDAPLHKAALNGRARSADFLIKAGANVNIRNEFAQTPLHAACVSGNIEVVQRLVQGGADTSAQDAAEVRK